MVEPTKELRRAVDTGNVSFGYEQAKKKIVKGECQLAIISSSAEKYRKESIEQACKASSVPFYEAGETSLQLGSICGKPFAVSFACIEKPGKSKILETVKQEKTR
ncbi:MAG: 50S ribosomal protein L30e [Candidatus Diapherotrites archaeon]|uniref:50S ribosomal protein L30e n=1 Tax=Candidatus Iainarchaeum sp. TaxID=3101447 RepID=A0A938YNA5_9ARCH|nr:50S ribosomal protein L30e [Candidatus Diapherotrites archaeon]